MRIRKTRRRMIVDVPIQGVPAADINAANNPEFCPKAAFPNTIHCEHWYDCSPCCWCGDDSVPEDCDCGRPGHAAGAK